MKDFAKDLAEDMFVECWSIKHLLGSFYHRTFLNLVSNNRPIALARTEKRTNGYDIKMK